MCLLFSDRMKWKVQDTVSIWLQWTSNFIQTNLLKRNHVLFHDIGALLKHCTVRNSNLIWHHFHGFFTWDKFIRAYRIKLSVTTCLHWIQSLSSLCQCRHSDFRIWRAFFYLCDLISPRLIWRWTFTRHEWNEFLSILSIKLSILLNCIQSLSSLSQWRYSKKLWRRDTVRKLGKSKWIFSVFSND